MITPAKVQELHDAYCDATGFQIRADYMRIRAWADWSTAGWTQADLHLVIRYLKREISKGNRNPGALKFSNLIMQLDRFEEDLALARKAIQSKPSTLDPRPSSTPVALTDEEWTAEAQAARAALAAARRPQ